MAPVNIYDAKTQFSKLVKRARAGEVIIIADAGVPVAKLVPFEEPERPRVLGAYRDKIRIADDAFAPMTAEDLAEWEHGPIFPLARPTRTAPKAKMGTKTKTKTKTKRKAKTKRATTLKRPRSKR